MIPAFSPRELPGSGKGLSPLAAFSGLAARWRTISRAPPPQGKPLPWEYALFALGIVALAAMLDPITADPLAPGHAALRLVAEWISDLGTAGYILVLSATVGLAALFEAARANSARTAAGYSVLAERALFIFVVVAASGIAAQIVKHTVGRARPRFLRSLGPYHFDVFSTASSTASFPSGHTTTAFAAAAALALFWPRGRAWLFAFAALVGLSRLLLGAHYLSDVLAGAALGLLSSSLLARRFARSLIALRPAKDGAAPRGRFAARGVLRRLGGSIPAGGLPR